MDFSLYCSFFEIGIINVIHNNGRVYTHSALGAQVWVTLHTSSAREWNETTVPVDVGLAWQAEHPLHCLLCSDWQHLSWNGT